MAKFRYTAKNMEGKTFRGTMEAAGEAALQQTLKEQGMFLMEAREVSSVREYRKLSSRQLSEFCKEVSTLLTSGVSIVRALEIVAEEEGIQPGVRSLYLSVLAELRKGISLSEAMESKKCFPELMLGMIRSGEGSGNIDVVMGRLALHYERENRLKQQVKSAMTYPVVLLVMSGIREVLGAGTFNGAEIFPAEYAAGMMALPVGGFLTLGVLIALMQWAQTKVKGGK